MKSPAAERRLLNVAYVVHAFAPGGLERCAAWLANRLNRNLFRPLVIALTESSIGSWLSADVPVIELRKPPGHSLRTVTRLARILADNQVDVVHSHNWPTLIESVLARRWAGTPFHLHAEHGLPEGDAASPLWRCGRAALMRWGFGQANCVVAVAAALRDQVTQFCHFPRERIRVIPNGVEIPPASWGPNTREMLRSSLGISPQALVVGSVGRLAPVKAFDMLIKAFEEVSCLGLGQDLHLVLVGDGPEAERLSRQAANSSCRVRIHLIGHQTVPADWLRAMDIYVNSSHSEGLSLAVLEAMGIGLPVIVTDVGDHGELVNGDLHCGIRVQPGDHKLLASAIDRLVKDSSLRHSFGLNAKSCQDRKYSISAMTSAYGMIYSSLEGKMPKRTGISPRSGRVQC
jgi:glycosyltransferase involved in cell wall biosynthesis